MVSTPPSTSRAAHSSRTLSAARSARSSKRYGATMLRNLVYVRWAASSLSDRPTAPSSALSAVRGVMLAIARRASAYAGPSAQASASKPRTDSLTSARCRFAHSHSLTVWRVDRLSNR